MLVMKPITIIAVLICVLLIGLFVEKFRPVAGVIVALVIIYGLVRKRL